MDHSFATTSSFNRRPAGSILKAGRLTRSFSNLLSGSKKVAGQEMVLEGMDLEEMVLAMMDVEGMVLKMMDLEGMDLKEMVLKVMDLEGMDLVEMILRTISSRSIPSRFRLYHRFGEEQMFLSFLNYISTNRYIT